MIRAGPSSLHPARAHAAVVVASTLQACRPLHPSRSLAGRILEATQGLRSRMDPLAVVSCDVDVRKVADLTGAADLTPRSAS